MLETATDMQEAARLAPEVRKLSQAELDVFWPAIQDLIDEKGSRILDQLSPVELYNALHLGVYDCWVGFRLGVLEGFVLCAWEVHPRVRYYHVLHAAGTNLSLYLVKGLDLIEKYAMILGAREVIVEGRKGWQRLLAQRGYATPTVKLRKSLKRWGH